MPRSSAIVRCTEKLTRPRNLPRPCTTAQSKQTAIHPVTCNLLSEVPVWPNFHVRFWPLKWKFSKMFPNSSMGHRTTSWPNLMKIGRCKVPERPCGLPDKKTRVPRDSSQPPFWPKWANRAQNSLNVVTPWYVDVYRISSGSAAFCRTYSG